MVAGDEFKESLCVCVCVCTVCASACVAEVDERKQSSGMFRQCEPSRQQAQEPSRQRPAMSVAVSSVVYSIRLGA